MEPIRPTRSAQLFLDIEIRRNEWHARALAQMNADAIVYRAEFKAAHRLNDARNHHDRCKKHAHLLQKKSEYHDEKLANALKDAANAVELAKANAPPVSVLVASVPIDDTTKATGEIENESPSLLVLEKNTDKGKINAQLGTLKPTPLPSEGAALQADSSSSAPSAPIGTFKCPLNTNENDKPSSRKDENNAQIDAQLNAQTPSSRLSSEGGVAQGHSSSSNTALSEHVDSAKICLSNGKPSYVPPNAQLNQTLINVPVGEPPPPRGGLSEHSRPRTRTYLRAQLPRGL